MLNFWMRVSLPVLYSAAIAIVLWAIFSLAVALAFFIILLLVIMAYRARQLYKLMEWLRQPNLDTVPEGDGIWDDLFSLLYRMVKRHNQTKQDLAAELQHMEQATAALPEGVVILNDANRIEWSNRLAQIHFNLDAQRDYHQDITYLVRQPEFYDYLQKANFDQPLVMRPARHEDLVLSIKLIPYSEDKRLMISSDITQMERVEAMRRDFVADVSHELRTPLTVVNGYVENLQDMPDMSQAQAQRALQLMGEQTSRMQNLVADLLTLSRLENDQVRLHDTTVDVRKLLNEILQDAQLINDKKHHLTLSLDSAKTLTGSLEELRSAFSNLVSNAIRYTPAGGCIALSWSERNGQLVFAVQDSGIGINPQHIPRLTERFYRVDRSRSRETGGTGLGLAIVKSVATRHNAKLEVESEEGKGSTFALVFANIS